MKKLVVTLALIFGFLMPFLIAESPAAMAQSVAPDKVWVRPYNGETAVEWTAVSGATVYTVKINGSEYLSQEGETMLVVNNIIVEPGDYTISVMANGIGGYSEEIVYSHKVSLERPGNIAVDENLLLSWDAVDHASGYRVVINGIMVADGITDNYLDLSAVITSPAAYTIKIAAVGDQTLYLNSKYSQAYTYTHIVNLSAPENVSLAPTESGYLLSWSNVLYASEYEVNIGESKVTTADNSILVGNYLEDAGEYQIGVKAKGEGLFADSDSAVITQLVQKTLDTPQVVCQNGVLSWQAVDNARTYTLTVDGIVVDSELSECAFDLNEYCIAPNKYYIQVAANTNGNYLSSDAADYVYEKFENRITPVLIIEGTTVAWNAVDGAGGYSVYINDECAVAMTDGHSFDFADYIAAYGTYVIAVQALESGYYSASETAYIQYVYEAALSAPVLDADGLIVSWTAVFGAKSYDVYIDGQAVLTGLTGAQADLTQYLCEDKDYVVGVRAVAENAASELATVTVRGIAAAQTVRYVINEREVNVGDYASLSTDFYYQDDTMDAPVLVSANGGAVELSKNATKLYIARKNAMYESAYAFYKVIDLSEAQINNDGTLTVKTEYIILDAEQGTATTFQTFTYTDTESGLEYEMCYYLLIPIFD